MSRRQRMRQGRRGGGWLVKALVVLLLLLTGAIITGHVTLQRYLRSDEFRFFLSQKVNEGLQVEGEFSELRWDGLAVGVDDYEAVGEQAVRRLRLEDVETEVGLSSFWQGVWDVKYFRVRQVELDLGRVDTSTPAEVVNDIESELMTGQQRDWVPREVDISRIEVGSMDVTYSVESGKLEWNGVAVSGKTIWGGGYDVVLSGGTLKTPIDKLPVLSAIDADLRYRDRSVFLNHANARFWDNGFIDVSGEFDSQRRVHAVQGTVGGVRCDEVLVGDWRQRVSGDLATDFKVVSRDGITSADGHLVVKRGVITALPLLDTLALYADTRRFRVLNLSEAHTDWHWRKGQWSLRNLVLASEGLLRLEGDLMVRGRELDGDFMLGIAPGTLSRIPGAESKVFLPGRNGLLWAPLKITGTIDNPQQDLKQRLVNAASNRFLTFIPEEGGKTLLNSGEGIGEAPGKVIKEVGGFLNTLFGEE